MHPHWYLMTATMPICFTVCAVLTILQTGALRRYPINISYENHIFSKRTELFCLYGQYLIGGLCAIQCFMCHISNYFHESYCIYGMSICVIIYAATKSCLYGFFLERSKCVQSSFLMLLPRIIWIYVFPIYIALYFMVYLILCPLTFRGAVVDPTKDDTVPTACLFGEFHPWIFTISAFVDVFNSICFLLLFMLPVYDLIKTKQRLAQQQIARDLEQHDDSKQDSEDTEHVHKDNLREVLLYNIICSTICSVSSVSFLFIMSSADNGDIGHYLWFGGNIDIMINSICLFLMLQSNRNYIRYLFSKMRGITLTTQVAVISETNNNDHETTNATSNETESVIDPTNPVSTNGTSSNHSTVTNDINSK